ncbi:MAG: NAD(P)H-dependent oxidoreductase subunit E [Candidatus Lokiarchaeota archaeon]|nr:NAD(P)H-dependent oxidoreductase subunit E [Candidatus Lokiarchaeota archaeon]
MIKIELCCGLNCLAHGGQELLDILENDEKYKKKCEIECVNCLDECGNTAEKSPVIKINNKIYRRITSDFLMDLLDRLISE